MSKATFKNQQYVLLINKSSGDTSCWVNDNRLLTKSIVNEDMTDLN
jgi:hypothetical protein